MSKHLLLGLLFSMVILSGCEGNEGGGLAESAAKVEGGVAIVFDLDHKPLPEIPMPNNVATRLAPETVTGRRLNISLEADTGIETDLRRKINELDGFGVFQPVTIPFSGPVDLKNLTARHNQDHSFKDDAVLLVNVDSKSEGFGEIIPLDLGAGNYSLALEWAHQYWDFDPHRDSPNLMFETHDEDKNGNGKLDPYEDIDFDGVLDKPNSWSGKPVPVMDEKNYEGILAAGAERPIDDLVSFYEKETNTLILQPLVPLRQATTYAVVVTRNMMDAQGNPVVSPFRYVNHISQNDELKELPSVLGQEAIGMSKEDIVFAWSFTTQSVTLDLEAVRAGLYGHGPFASLQDEYPATMEARLAHPVDPKGNPAEKPYTLGSEELGPLFEAIAGPVLLYPQGVVAGLKEDNKYTDYWVLGEYTTPYFLADKDGIATEMYPADDNESYDINPLTGAGTHGPNRVTFMCSIPKAHSGFKPPFPVVMYGHGYSGALFEIFGFAGRFAEFGYALCAMDVVGHGIALPSDENIDYASLVPMLLGPLGLTDFYNALVLGRIRDLDNDGVLSSFDNGGDFWSWDLFHTRDMVRQAVIDHMQFIRVLRSLGTAKWKTDINGNGKADDLAGDFNGDGVVDLGTPKNRYYPQWGQSMGAIISQITAAVEATVSTATPISGAGGLAQVGVRSTNPGVPEAVFMPMMGPFVVFTPVSEVANEEDPEAPPAFKYDKASDTVEIAFMINNLHQEYFPDKYPRVHYYPLVHTTDIAPGDAVVIRNLDNGKEIRAFRDPEGGGFRVSVPCDALNAVQKRAVLGLVDGDKSPVNVGCAPGTWTVPTDEKGNATGPGSCDEPDLARAALLGDRLEIEVLSGWNGERKVLINALNRPVTFQGAYFPVGSPIVALGAGFGEARNTPAFRRLMGYAAMIVTRGDPIAYVRHYSKEGRLDFSYDPDAAEQANTIIYHTVGDPNVPIYTSLNLARGAGILEYLPDSGDPKAVTQNDRLIAGHVSEGVEWLFRFTSDLFTVADWDTHTAWKTPPMLKDMRWTKQFSALLESDPTRPMPLHSDPDDLDGGVNEYGEQTVGEPVRATSAYDEKSGTMKHFPVPTTGVVENKVGFHAFRIPYIAPLGSHGVEPSNPDKAFDMNNFVENQIGLFMTSNGTKFSDDPCLATSSCPFLPEAVRKVGEKIYKD